MRRRVFIRQTGSVLMGGLGGLGSLLSAPAWAQSSAKFADSFWECPRSILLRHRSGDVIEQTFWRDGNVIPDAHEEISWFLRDREVNKAVLMHLGLLDVLYAVGGWLKYFGVQDTIIVNSGYRDPVRNLAVEGAARDSLHTVGKAADIRVQNVSELQVARFGAWLSSGGVGWYPGKVFTHLDVGASRVWKG